ncbi:MAG: DUF1653 domain-containing protein [Burkholderiales bacterium]|nr:DUF1653 domain-containing protein [Burkholderiales bacterium]
MSELYYRHLDGGYYRLVSFGRSADTDGEVAIYQHLWPFDASWWTRDRAEFLARFSPISADELGTAVRGDRAAAQVAVNAAKAARRAGKPAS